MMSEASPDKNVEALREMLLRRSQVGLRKYGVTTCQNKLSLVQWIDHAIEECLDQAVYLMSIKNTVTDKPHGEPLKPGEDVRVQDIYNGHIIVGLDGLLYRKA